MKKPPHKLQSTFISRFCLLILLPFTVIVAFYFVESTKNLRLNDDSTNDILSSQVIYNLSKNLDFAENVAKSILENEMLISFLDKPYKNKVDLDYYISTVYDFVKISNGIASDFRLRIYLKNESIPIGYNTFYHIKDIIDIPIITDFTDSQNNGLWIDGNQLQLNKPEYHSLHSENDYCYLKKITHQGSDIGLILIQMPKQLLRNITPPTAAGVEQAYNLLATEDTLIYNFAETEISNSTLSTLQNAQSGIVRDKSHVYGIYLQSDYPWDIIVATTPTKAELSLQLLILLFLSFNIITVWIFIRYSKRILGDINYCLDAMNQSIDNNFQTELHVNRKDEILFIAQRINFLLKRIRNLILLNIKQETAAKNAQLIALQHQINPHFLYNTMEIFSAKMELSGLYEESSAMAAFCRMLRYNIASDTMTATLFEELTQIESYIKIQSIREIAIDLQIDIPQEAYHAKIIKFILQPIIENSVKYRNPDTPLKIKVSATQEGDIITLAIQDNGIGISPRQLKRLNDRFTSDKHEVNRADVEIGLFNINERLKLFYGKEYHLTASMEDELTTFKLFIKTSSPLK